MDRFKKLLRGVTATMLAVGLLAGGVTGTANAADNNTYDLWFGDSQMYGHGIKDANTRQAKRFSRLVSDADNATDVNVAVSGTNWTGTTSNRFGSQIDKLIANYSGKNVRRIIGQGVHNDAKENPSISAKSTDAELKAKAQAIADTAQPYYTKLRAAFPNAQIAYIPQVTVWGSAQKSNAFFCAVLKMGAYLADDLKQQGWTVMDLQTDLDLIGDHQDYLADIIHVNEKGHAAAAQGIIKWLDTTDVPVSSDKPSNGGTGATSPSTHDISKVGTVKFTDLLANNKGGLSLNSNNHVYPDDGQGWKHFQATAQLDIHINNIGSLREGDKVTIPLSKTGRFGWNRLNVLPNVKNGVGDVIFTASASDTAITLTRTAAPAVGAFDYRLQPLIDGWYPYPASIGAETTLTAGGSSYTFTSTLPTENSKLWYDAMHVYGDLGSSLDLGLMSARLLGGASHDAIANGQTPSSSKEPNVFHIHIVGNDGHKVTVRGVELVGSSYTAYDATHAGFSYSADVTGGIDTTAKEGSTAEKGGWTKTVNQDGSIDLSINVGALWGDKAVRYNAGAKSYDDTTNQYLKANGNLPDEVDGGIIIGFDSSTDPRSASYTSEVTCAGKTTRLESGTVRNGPVSNTIAAGESAIEYVGNGASGGSYLFNTGKPGSTATTAPANQFSRSGYTFTGWNTKMDGTGTAYHAGAAIVYPAESKTLTLYAQWKVSSHTVTFDSNGGSAVSSQTVDDKGKAKEPTAPTRDSWTFAGWYLNGVKYDFTTPVTQDITLKAGWKRVAPSMEFKDMHKRISAGSKSGQQKLTLDVKGTGETNKSVTPSDVVILVDETNSMRECADGSSEANSGIQCSTGPSKRDNLGNIIDSAVTSILATNTGRSADQQSRISVIRFAGRNSKNPPKALSQFTTDKNVALPNGWNQGDDLSQTGTDWATALEHVGEAGTTRSNVNKQIILVTDGLASAANEDYIKAGTNANALHQIKNPEIFKKVVKAHVYANQRTMAVTQSLAKAGWHLRVVGVSVDASATAMGDSYLAGNYPYVGKDGSIGFYKKGSQPSGYSSQIEWIASVANNAGDGTAIGSDFEATDINDITSTLTSTVITSTTMRNTVISDPLSEWVDPVGLVDGKGTGITVSKDGKPMDSGYTAVYDGSSRTVKVSLPDSLADGSVYSVSFEVVLSDKARSNYMQSGTYPDTGDADTGTTSAGKKGYFTNGNATLSWDAVTSTNGTPLIVSHKAKYAKPVASYDSSNVPPVLTNKLPGTGGVASLMPVFIGAGLALALAAAWIVRKHLARLP